MAKLVSFEKALKEADGYSTKHLLLGNGFSIACVPSIFTYVSLFEETDFTKYPEIKDAFKRLRTTDFELLINVLSNAATVFPPTTKKVTQRVIK